MNDILFVGALTLDRIHRLKTLPMAPGKYLPLETVTIAAGMASSAAIGATRLGARASLLACVGDDAAGDRLLGDMERGGIDCSLVRKVSGVSSATASILVDSEGERIIVPDYPPELVATEPGRISVAKFSAVMADPRWPNGAEAALSAARADARIGILDCDVAPAEQLTRLLPLASHVVASLPGAQVLAGAVAAEAAAARLAELTSGEIIVTDGARGSYYHDRVTKSCVNVPAYVVDVVDTTAAGDVFHGAFATALSSGLSILESLRFSAAAAALKCTRFGGVRGAPTLEEVKAFMETTCP